jgi:flavin reductase (DIM6/NTAB) family NADH-FMN oxidoreductase RutF
MAVSYLEKEKSMTALFGEVDSASLGPESLSPDHFKAIFRQHPAGVAVVTLRHRERLVGFTATSVISVSAEPPLLAFSVAGGSSSWVPLSEADTVVINFLSADQVDLSARFATSGIDRFACGGWSLLDSGEPVLDGAPRWVRAKIIQRTRVGSSQLICLEAISSSIAHDVSVSAEPAGRDVPPLVYHDRVYHRLDTASAL